MKDIEIEASIDIRNCIPIIKSKLYNVNLYRVELAREYIYLYGKIFDNKLKKYFDFNHYVDLSDFINEDYEEEEKDEEMKDLETGFDMTMVEELARHDYSEKKEVRMKSIVTAEIEIVAIGTGSTSLSHHISNAVKVLEKLGVKYQLTPMGTVIEVSSIEDVFNVVRTIHENVFTNNLKRLVTHITIDDRRDTPKGMNEKIESVKKNLSLDSN